MEQRLKIKLENFFFVGKNKKLQKNGKEICPSQWDGIFFANVA